MATFTRHAVLDWSGDVMHGTGTISAGTGAFSVGASFPRVAGDPTGVTTPEELLAAAHAICYGVGLRSAIAQRGGTARRVKVTATITADKGSEGIRIRASHLVGVVEGLNGIPPASLPEVAAATEKGCTISIALRGSVAISHDVTATD